MQYVAIFSMVSLASAMFPFGSTNSNEGAAKKQEGSNAGFLAEEDSTTDANGSALFGKSNLTGTEPPQPPEEKAKPEGAKSLASSEDDGNTSLLTEKETCPAGSGSMCRD